MGEKNPQVYSKSQRARIRNALMKPAGITGCFDALRRKGYELAGHVIYDRPLHDIERDRMAAMLVTAWDMESQAGSLAADIQKALIAEVLSPSRDSVVGLTVQVEPEDVPELELPTPPCDCDDDGCEKCDNVWPEYAYLGLVVALVEYIHHQLVEPSEFHPGAYHFPLVCKFEGVDSLVVIPQSLVYDYRLPDGRIVEWRYEDPDDDKWYLVEGGEYES